ncbi:TauD/TfdA family dioxygenase [Actinomadura fibrosa]|uniref:TauD/TfdA family dioxygenase n=1 Tax=Actinomadura fibrosa TaxID=111802 RepID=A0ABW2XY61_9ACTN|nr:TauD/TfdA family dioxygenase [Actinomadura fibrosa]
MARTLEYTLDPQDVAALRAALADLRRDGLSPVEPPFYERRWDCQDLLPAGLRRRLDDFRRNEPSAACLIRGFPVDDGAVGPTPGHWERPEGHRSTIDSDLYMAMCGMALGEPFAWATLQFGRLVQDVFPVKGDERRMSGHGSEAYLLFHTDDAFRADSCDYLLLFGVRNADRTPTYISSARDLSLSERDRRLLSEPRFHIVPDDEHIRQLELRAPGDPALARALEARDEPRPVPVLFGSADHPYIRYDEPFMDCAGDDPAARRALDALRAELERVRQPVVVDQGTLLVLDNHAAAHARESFTARYDGTDRWLRKLIVSRGRRRWTGDATEPGGRIIL